MFIDQFHFWKHRHLLKNPVANLSPLKCEQKEYDIGDKLPRFLQSRWPAAMELDHWKTSMTSHCKHHPELSPWRNETMHRLTPPKMRAQISA